MKILHAGGGGGFSVSRYSSYSSRDSESDLSSSRFYSPASRYNPVTSPTSVRRTYTSPSYTSRYIPSNSRWTSNVYSDEEEDSYTRRRNAREERLCDDRSRTESNTDHRNGKEEARPSSRQPQVTVLNEGAIIIRRQGRVDTSDEESESEPEAAPEPEVPKTPTPPPRDPLEVEEEMLNEKLQTAGFFLSMPEEEQIKKRLLEIKQMRENPEWFRMENTKVVEISSASNKTILDFNKILLKNFKYNQVSTETAKSSIAKEEEEKILLLRLNSRGIGEVEQTDVQVRLQEIWRDRREEVTIGIGRMEQHYEHILSECSTEISELEGSIGHKYAAIAKLQEELLVLSIRKDRVSADMEKVENIFHYVFFFRIFEGYKHSSGEIGDFEERTEGSGS